MLREPMAVTRGGGAAAALPPHRLPVASGWWIALGFAVALRFALSADRDILALNQPYDDYWFVSTAFHDIWRVRYDQLAFAQLQLFAIWLRFDSLFGIPARLAIDLLWVGASFYACTAVARLCRRAWPGAVVFTFLAFHPLVLVLFDRALSENLMACLTTVSMAAFIDVWNFRVGGPQPSTGRRRLALWIGSIAFAAAYHCRKEGFLIGLPLLVLLAAAFFDRARGWRSFVRSPAAVVVAGASGATIALGVALAGANAAATGVFARYELAAPNYQRAIHALNAIAPDKPTPRFVTVTAATRAAAYAASPTFRELHEFLDGAAAASLTATTELYTGVKGEIGNGWFYWTLRDAAATAGWHRSAVEAERKYAAMSDEIEQAFDAGTLTRRAAPIPFVDPDWRKWLPFVPAALLKEWLQVITPEPQSLYRLSENADLTQRDIYTRITGRRRPFQAAYLRGWITAPAGSRIGLVSGEDPGTWITLSGVPRVDVANAYQFEVETIDANEFTQLVVDTPDHRRSHVRYFDLIEDHVHQVAPDLVLGVDRLSPRARPPWANRGLPKWVATWSVAGWLFMAAGALGVVAALVRRPVTGALGLLLIAAFAAIASRVALLAVLETTSWSGGTRYLLPILPFVALLGPIGLCAIVDAAGHRKHPDVV